MGVSMIVQIPLVKNMPWVVVLATAAAMVVSVVSARPALAFPAVGCDCAPAFLVGRDGRFNNGATIGGSIAANDVGGSIRLSQRVTMADGTSVTGDRVVAGRGASVDDVFANQLSLGPEAVVRGTQGTPTLPVISPFCTVPAITCGGNDVIVAPGQDVGPLAPGTYGRLRVLTGGSITLSPGEFTFCDVKLGREVTMVTLGQATLNVAGNVTIGDDSMLGPASGTDPVQVNVAGRRVRVSNNAVATAAVVAPDAQISLGRDADLLGCFCVDRAKSDKGIILDCTGTTTTTTTTTTTPTTTTSSTTGTSSTTTPTTTTSSTTETSTTTTTTTTTTTSTTLAPVKIAGVRYRSFANTGGDEIYLGTGDLGVAANRTAEQVTWVKPGTYDFTFTYDPGVPELRTTVLGVGNPVNETVVRPLAGPRSR
jgi:hypothetical protein